MTTDVIIRKDVYLHVIKTIHDCITQREISKM